MDQGVEITGSTQMLRTTTDAFGEFGEGREGDKACVIPYQEKGPPSCKINQIDIEIKSTNVNSEQTKSNFPTAA